MGAVILKTLCVEIMMNTQGAGAFTMIDVVMSFRGRQNVS